MRPAFKGIRNVAIGAFQLALPLPLWLKILVCAACFGTAIGWFYRAAQRQKGREGE